MSDVAYFSMDMALESGIPTYSGGLGVLAGDALRAAADLGLPMVGVSLLYGKGYFRQHLDEAGNQTESDDAWTPDARFREVTRRVSLPIEGREVIVRGWEYLIRGVGGHEVSVYLLDTNLPENAPEDREITDHLYGGDQRYRLAQEAVLGIGGVLMLRALGYWDISTFHMNEGHSALLVLPLFKEQLGRRAALTTEHVDQNLVRSRCVFTTHTPVPAGHDHFSWELVESVLGEEYVAFLQQIGCTGETLNMTQLALLCSRFVNAVARRHAEVSREMFPEYTVHAITNGVHAQTWLSGPFTGLLDRHIPDWRRDNSNLRHAVAIPLREVEQAHLDAKAQLLDTVAQRAGVKLNPTTFTVGFARRAATYKRADLVFSDLPRLRWIAERVGPLQFVYSGKAHPHDKDGKDVIRRIFEADRALADVITVVYLENYDMDLGATLCAGVDLWLNTPEQPLEASGTSGMKAALNGVPSLSVLDGWWLEGHLEGVTGWAIGSGPWDEHEGGASESDSLYAKLESTIVPMFYGARRSYNAVMRSAIEVNGSYFNTQRMVSQYASSAYQLPAPPRPPAA